MRLFENLKSSQAIYAKGFLFVILAILSGGLLIARAAELEIAFLLAICLWASCRAYYFAFYVIEHYVDPTYRFSGLVDFCKYMLSKPAEQDENREE
ncbi:MAG: hypothetical protein AB8B91_03715 [Rubripirellula sp.]